jgi:hypothetical protein
MAGDGPRSQPHGAFVSLVILRRGIVIGVASTVAAGEVVLNRSTLSIAHNCELKIRRLWAGHEGLN